MISRNEIMEQNQVILLQAPHTTTSYQYDGVCATLIEPSGYANTYVLFDNDVAIQTWEVQLENGNEATARMIIWLGEHKYAN